MPFVEKEGDFVADIVGKTLKTFPSGSVAIAFRFSCVWFWNGTEWTSADGATCYGDFFIIGKGGHALEAKIQEIVRATGWDGDLGGVDDPLWVPPQVRITVKREAGQDGRTYYKAAWINHRDSAPAVGMRGASEDEVRAAAAKYGSLLKAIAKKAAVAAPPPATPPGPDDAPPLGDEDIPF